MSVRQSDTPTSHTSGVQRLLDSYRDIPADVPVRLAKPTSTLFRARARRLHPGLDSSGLVNVIAVDPQNLTADVEGMCTYEDLLAATLAYGLAPLVVPPLKTITAGGTVSGLGIESASFRNGLAHESVLEMEVLTGAGELLTVSRRRHEDLFRAFPNSYGTLGYATRLRIELEPVKPFVALRHIRFDRLSELVSTMDRIVDTGGLDGVAVDYLDGVVFNPHESYLCLGIHTDTPGAVSDYTGRQIYYRSIRHPSGITDDRLTIGDYFWRWDTDWFWRSRAFGAQRPLLRRAWPRRYLHSNFYSKLTANDQRFAIADRMHRRRHRPPQERVTQEFEVGLQHCEEFLEWSFAHVPIEPLWLCPLRLRNDEEWPLYPIRPNRTYVNIGFWSSVPAGATEGATTRLIEAKVRDLDGRKSLHSDSYYTATEFDALYGGQAYRAVKRTYDPQSRLLDLYDKAVRRR